MSHRSRSLTEIPKSNISLAKDTLETARTDLKSAKALYESECYPTAIYHLQQSLEKSWKSFGFYYGIITEGQARSKDIIGHKGSKVCNRTITVLKKVISHMRIKIKALKNFRNTESANQMPPILGEDLFKELDDGIDDLIREINTFTASEDRIRNMPYDEMKKLIDNLTALQQSLHDAEENLNDSKFTNDVCEKMRLGAYRFYRPLVAGNPFAEKVLKKTVWENLTDDTIREIMRVTLHSMAVTGPLFNLAVITQVHEQTTRYRVDGISPTAIYNSSHPMIQLFPSIHSLAETTLANLERLYEEIPPEEEESL